MQIVVKRARKYFQPKDGNSSPVLEEKLQNSDLLRTIKLGKNLFKLSLPEATYDQNTNYATVPNPLRKDNSIILRKDQSMDRIEVKQNVNKI